jgi:hypothetical protein
MMLFTRRTTGTASVVTTADKRAQVRTAVHLSLTLFHDDSELAGCHVRDINSKGAFIVLPRDAQILSRDHLGLRFHIWTGYDHITRILRARAIRHERGGLAVVIIDHERITKAVVHDIYYYQQRIHRKTDGLKAIFSFSQAAAK